MLMGLGDWATALAIYCSIAITVFGVIYGAVHWNRADDDEPPRGGRRFRTARRKRRQHRSEA